MPGDLGQGLAQLAAGRLEMLGDDPHIGKHRHEIGVTGPARHDVLMQVVGHAGAGNRAEIHADIETLRLAASPAGDPGRRTVRPLQFRRSPQRRAGPGSATWRNGATIRCPFE
ncbi:MAG: hypothetical protein M0C28_37015 [Candidatus Moduliflexus flocculans]|nr:hypothetical protein [Candidatus Moduliflexus flocculans]